MKNTLLLVIFLFATMAFSQEKDIPNNEKPVEFIMVQNPPVYKGCEGYKSTSSKSICSNKKLTEHIDKNFDTSVSTNTNLEAGNYELTVIFIVDKQGLVTNVKTKGSDYTPFVNEAIRLINSVPQYSTPGMQREKVVNVRYTIPIVFTVIKYKH
jgi:protein TonB